MSLPFCLGACRPTHPCKDTSTSGKELLGEHNYRPGLLFALVYVAGLSHAPIPR